MARNRVLCPCEEICERCNVRLCRWGRAGRQSKMGAPGELASVRGMRVWQGVRCARWKMAQRSWRTRLSGECSQLKMKNTAHVDEAQNCSVSRQDEMAILSSEIARLAQRLAELTTEEIGVSSELSAGVRVQVLRQDVYYLRVGTVVRIRSWKGRHWCVKLDATNTAKGTEIWKKEKYLEVLREEEEDREI